MMPITQYPAKHAQRAAMPHAAADMRIDVRGIIRPIVAHTPPRIAC
ncbi:hypothetical protein [Burkholderia sp. BE17]|nr:hypothetical protein [Burkholderia sp. BE17]